MDILIKEIIDLIKKRWPRRSTLLLLLILTLLIMLLLFSAINFQKISWFHLLIILSVFILLSLFWFFSTRLPKTPKGEIGFGLAIDFETEEQNKKIVSDFVITLRELLQSNKFRYPYHFIVFSQHHSEKIKTLDDAVKYLYLSRVNYLIWGRARTRQISGQVTSVLNLEGLVRHRPVNQKIHQSLAVEFAEIFPRRLLIASENDIFSFEFTAEWMHLVATYIIGLAALISGDIIYAQELFEYLAQTIQKVNTDLPAIIKLRHRLPSRLSDVYLVRTNALINEWSRTKDPRFLLDARIFLDKLQQVDPPNYDAHIRRSIVYFVLDRDIPGAKKELDKCKTNHSDIIWRYNLAFLLAYEGNLSKAFFEYKRAFRAEISPQALNEIESFILWILDKEPDKIQLRFLLGLLYLRKLDNPSQALLSLEEFMCKASKDLYSEQILFAQEQIKVLSKLLKKSG